MLYAVLLFSSYFYYFQRCLSIGIQWLSVTTLSLTTRVYLHSFIAVVASQIWRSINQSNISQSTREPA